MKRALLLPLGALCLAACQSKEAKPPPSAPAAQPAAAPAAAELPAIPSQDDADAKAAKSIHPENADSELEKLKQELGGGG